MWVEASSTRVDRSIVFTLSDCIHACARASAMRSTDGKTAMRVLLGVWGTANVYSSLQSFEDFTKVSSSPPVLPMHIQRSLVVSDGSSARWLATVAAAVAMPFPGVTGTQR